MKGVLFFVQCLSLFIANPLLADSWSGIFSFYQKVISPADGARCGFYPTCADYSYQAIRKHGPIWGIWMSTDRFMRDHGHNEGSYDLIEKYGKRRLFDPIDANDFWFVKVTQKKKGEGKLPTPTKVSGSFPSHPLEFKTAQNFTSTGESSTSASTPLFQFADSLFREEDYYRAITEYKRFVFLHPKHPKSEEAKFLIGFSYLKGEKWDAAIEQFETFSEPLNSFSEKKEFLTGQTHFLANRKSTARSEWQNFIKHYPKSKFADASRYQMGWSYFLEEDREKAKEEFRKINKKEIQQHAIQMTSEIDRWNDHPRRSPFLAGMMSAIVPGSGQWYTGRFWDGCSALLLNGIFIYGVYKTVDEKLYIPAGILSFFGLGFYGGNIFSAISGAHKFNQNVKESHRQRLKIQHGLKFKWENGGLTLYF